MSDDFWNTRPQPKVEDAEIKHAVEMLRDDVQAYHEIADLLERLAADRHQWKVDCLEFERDVKAAEAKLAATEAELVNEHRNVEQLEETLETLTTQQATFLCDRELQESAIDLVALWNAQKISGATRAERNAAIEDVRARLIGACERHAARQQQASAERDGETRAKELGDG